MIIPHLTQYNSPYLSKYNTGLGNALFQIFTAYGLSKKYNKILNNIELKQLLEKLKNNFGLDHENTIYRNLKFYYDNTKPIYTISEHPDLYSSYNAHLDDFIKNQINNEYTIYIKGYLQSHLYFNDYYDEICELIKPDLKSYSFIKTNYIHLFNEDIINISIHIRINWGSNIKYNNNYLYFYEAIDYIVNNINTNKKIIINIFSDDIIEFQKYFNYTKYECVFYINNQDYIDLWCMSLCNHNILSNSTLSWWGAYINKSPNKLVVYPKDILRLHGCTVYNEHKHIERAYEHYKTEWISLDTNNVIFQ